MAARWTSRKLYLYSLHVHRGKRAVSDYAELFREIARLSVRQRAITTSDRLTALRTVVLDGSYVSLVAYEGPPGLAPLIFDLAADEERLEELGAREVMATRTHAIVNLSNRDTVVEYNHRGAKARDLAQLIAVSGQKALKRDDLIVELSPVAAPDFAKAIDDFETIKIASLNIIRPNLNWNKERNHAAALAQESEGQRVEVAVFAGGGEGLARRKGIVSLIKSLGRESKSNLRNASVSGRRKGERSDTTISLERHLEHRNVRVRLGPGGHPDSLSVEERIKEFLGARKKSNHVKRRDG
jgi:hypothetical protein